MMTLKLDMKHICKKGRGGRSYLGMGGVSGRWEEFCRAADGIGWDLRASLQMGSRCRDPIVPR